MSLGVLPAGMPGDALVLLAWSDGAAGVCGGGLMCAMSELSMSTCTVLVLAPGGLTPAPGKVCPHGSGQGVGD